MDMLQGRMGGWASWSTVSLTLLHTSKHRPHPHRHPQLPHRNSRCSPPHLQYCGSSLSRVGLDFQGLLQPLFEACVLGLLGQHLASAVEVFNARWVSARVGGGWHSGGWGVAQTRRCSVFSVPMWWVGNR